jgi:micrococcal nuclease
VAKAPEPKEGVYKVTKVIDGDTIEIETGERVRLLGIDTPELNARWGTDARKQTYQLVYGKDVRLELDHEKRDKYNRILAYVWLGDLLVNEKLVKDGYARLYVFDKEAKIKYFDRLKFAQDFAIEHNDGLWFYGWDKNVPFYYQTAP